MEGTASFLPIKDVVLTFGYRLISSLRNSYLDAGSRFLPSLIRRRACLQISKSVSPEIDRFQKRAMDLVEAFRFAGKPEDWEASHDRTLISVSPSFDS
jgi:hypothetical protein